jgi:hypothetical protein
MGEFRTEPVLFSVGYLPFKHIYVIYYCDVT